MNGQPNDWSHWLVQWTDGAGRQQETLCSTVDVAYETAEKCAGTVHGVRRRGEQRQGQTVYEMVPVDREGRPL